MRKRWQTVAIVISITTFFLVSVAVLPKRPIGQFYVSAQTLPTPADFDQTAALSALRESIKGREQEPAEKVFKNIQSLKGMPARNVLGIMQMGFSRSLGVDCTHCHTPGKWEAEDKTQKQTARDMWAMVQNLNGTTLKNIKNLRGPNPTVNCTTCHRGEIKPALNLAPRS
ncbi:MAG: c-type cytochrome [Pyrinomonadaceae bacterium]